MEPATLLWLDDERDPSEPRYQRYFPIASPKAIWIKTYRDFTAWIHAHGLPGAICFDHDLGDGPSGFDAAKMLVDYCLARDLPLPAWAIQSANPIGRENIDSLLHSYQAHRG